MSIFVTHLKECLAPKLKRGNVVMMDNLPVHRVAAVREVIEAAGAKLRYLPKYSPELNPLEQVLQQTQGASTKSCPIPRLSRRIATLVAAFCRQECTNYFRHAGYASSITVVIFCWHICLISESMGHHDSEIMDDRSID
jgi:transposase